VYPPITLVRRLMWSSCCLCSLREHLECVAPNFLVFYAMRIVSNESWRILLPGTSCGVFMDPFVCPLHTWKYGFFAMPATRNYLGCRSWTALIQRYWDQSWNRMTGGWRWRSDWQRMLPFIWSLQSVLPLLTVAYSCWRPEEVGAALWRCSTGNPTDSESYMDTSCSQFYVKHFYSIILVHRSPPRFGIQDIEG
jgi:hypothetical protein